MPCKLEDEHKAFLARIVDEGAMPAIHGVVRWRACDLIMRLHEEFGLSVCDCPARSSWMAWRQRTDNPTKHVAIAAATAVAGTQQSREHLAIYASKRFFMISRSCRSQTHRTKFLRQSQRHMDEVFVNLYGGYATKLLRLQLDMIQALDRHRRGNQQTVEVRHVHIYPRAQGVVGIVNPSQGAGLWRAFGI
jgi:hypothetical protein